MNRNYLLLYVLLTLIFFVAVTVSRVAIIGGEEAKEHQFTYEVSLWIRDNKNKCGGGIIDDYLIVTAAHCVVNSKNEFNNDSITIIAGTNDLHKTHESAVTRDVHKIYIPKEYVAHDALSPGDIAVLKLKQPLELSKHTHLELLKLPEDKHEHYIDKTAIFAGFGWDEIEVENGEENGRRSNYHLRFAEVDVLGSGQRHHLPFINSALQFSARVKQNNHSGPRGTCIGDSGGPLVHGKTIIGILSLSPQGCSEKDYGAIYTRVSHYTKFIEDVIYDRKEPYILTHVLP